MSESEAPPQGARRHPRVAVEVEVSLESEHNFYAGFLENVSVSGIFVATHVTRAIGDRLDFSIDLHGADGPVSGVGEVRWIREYSETSEASPGVGLRFIELAPGGLEKIEGFLSARKPLFFDDDLAG